MSQEVIVVDEQTAKDGKLLAILSHFWVIGTIIAWVLNLKKQNEFTSFYVRQMIGFQLVSFLLQAIVSSIVGGFITWVLGVVLFAFWVISLIGSFGTDLKFMPFIGEYFQKIFKSL